MDPGLLADSVVRTCVEPDRFDESYRYVLFRSDSNVDSHLRWGPTSTDLGGIMIISARLVSGLIALALMVFTTDLVALVTGDKASVLFKPILYLFALVSMSLGSILGEHVLRLLRKRGGLPKQARTNCGSTNCKMRHGYVRNELRIRLPFRKVHTSARFGRGVLAACELATRERYRSTLWSTFISSGCKPGDYRVSPRPAGRTQAYPAC